MKNKCKFCKKYKTYDCDCKHLNFFEKKKIRKELKKTYQDCYEPSNSLDLKQF